MLRITKNNEDVIIIRELPIVRWISYLAVGIFFSIPVCFALSRNTDSSRLIYFLGPAAVSTVFLFLALAVPVTTTKINKPGKTISVRKQSLLKYRFTVYSCSEISGEIYVEATEGGRGGTVYQLVMPLKNGKKVALSTVDGSPQSQYFDAAHLMNPFIVDTTKQIPFELTVFYDS